MDMHRYHKAHPNGEWSMVQDQEYKHNSSDMINVNESGLFQEAVSALINRIKLKSKASQNLINETVDL